MPLNSRLKRKSAIGVGLPFGRLGPVVDGNNLDTAAQRQVAVGAYALLQDAYTAPDPSGGLTTRRKRSSAINVCLPFGRVGPFPDGDGLGTQGERIHAAYGYEIVSGGNPPPFIAILSGFARAQRARIDVDLRQTRPVRPVRPARPVRFRTGDWRAIVARVDPGAIAARNVEVAYDFGQGKNRRVFIEKAPYE